MICAVVVVVVVVHEHLTSIQFQLIRRGGMICGACSLLPTKYVVGYLISPTKDSAFEFLCLFMYPFTIREEVFISVTDPFSFSFHFGGTKSYNPTSLDAILLFFG